eukprot:jgi/Chrzof1/7751/Cz02g35130.t1
MAEDNFDPSQSAALRLYSHILQKGFQAGSIIGVGIVAPILAYRQGSLDLALLTRAAGRGALWGTAATAVLGALKISQTDQEGLEDRVYRLHYNEGQNRTDLFAQVGAVVGFAAGAALLGVGKTAPINFVGSAALGATAVLIGGVYICKLHMITGPCLLFSWLVTYSRFSCHRGQPSRICDLLHHTV